MKLPILLFFFPLFALANRIDILSFEPLSSSYGTIQTQTASTRTIKLINVSRRKIISGFWPSNQLGSAFSYDGGKFPGLGGNCYSNTTLNPGESCTITIRFAPNREGKYCESVRITFRVKNSYYWSEAYVHGEARDSEAFLGFTEGTSHDFASRPLNHQTTKTLTVKNTGQKRAKNVRASVNPSSPFGYLGGTYPGTGGTCTNGIELSQNQTCTVVVSFLPTVAGSFSSSLTVTADKVDAAATMAFQGIGQTPQPAGSSDTSFGNPSTGVATASVGTGPQTLSGLQVVGDEKLVGGGFALTGANNDFVVTRFKMDGSADTSFNGTGATVVDFGNTHDIVQSVAVDSQERTLLVGHADRSIAVARITTNGQLDTSFSGDGKWTFHVNNESDDFSYGSAIQTDGKIVIAGTTNYSSRYKLLVIRLNSDGTLDTTFNSTGFNALALGFDNAFAFDVRMQSDGKILAVGFAAETATYDFVAIRLNSNGTLDNSFGTNGVRFIDFGNTTDLASDFTTDSSGNLYIAGRVRTGDSVRAAVAKLDSSGNLVTTYGSSGKTLLPSTRAENLLSSIGVASDGSALVSWYAYRSDVQVYVQLTKLTATGAIDTSFGTNGTLSTQIKARDNIRPPLSLQSDGKAVLGGTNSSVGDSSMSLGRYW